MTQLLTSKRAKCINCGYPQSTCLCAWVKVIDSPVKIVILQHPKEANHAKNTVKLLQLGLTNLEIIQGEDASDFKVFANTVAGCPEKYVLCYPHAKSKAIESLKLETDFAPTLVELDTLILIDASWRKALKIWHLNPWLQKLNSWHFADPPQNQYDIRQTKQKNSLSTLESVAYLLNLTYALDCSTLLGLFEQMQARCFLNQRQKD